MKLLPVIFIVGEVRPGMLRTTPISNPVSASFISLLFMDIIGGNAPSSASIPFHLPDTSPQ